MRPKRYPYTKPQWEKEYANVYWDSSNEPLATFVTHINRLTGEVKSNETAEAINCEWQTNDNRL